jgi:hypothetical protein
MRAEVSDELDRFGANIVVTPKTRAVDLAYGAVAIGALTVVTVTGPSPTRTDSAQGDRVVLRAALLPPSRKLGKFDRRRAGCVRHLRCLLPGTSRLSTAFPSLSFGILPERVEIERTADQSRTPFAPGGIW